jgi:hypothetical protein
MNLYMKSTYFRPISYLFAAMSGTYFPYLTLDIVLQIHKLFKFHLTTPNVCKKNYWFEEFYLMF